MSVAQALREPEVFTQGKEDLVYEDGLAGMSNPKLVARGAETALAAERARKLEAAAAAPLGAVGVSATASTPVAAEGAAANDDAVASMTAKTVCSGVVYHFDREERRRARKMRIEQLRAEVGAEPLQGFEARPAFRFAKRSFDIVFSAGVCVIAAIPVAVASAAIAIESPGKPFFRQERIGQYGKPIRIFKLRSMVADAHTNPQKYMTLEQYAVWKREQKLDDDPRVTKVGRVLRRTSLDELPQFLNVLNGDMSVIGPRPVTIEETYEFGNVRDEVLSVRPGITGLWQSTDRNEATWENGRRQKLELEYVRNRGFAMDARCFFGTFGAMFGKNKTGR